jgi:hypothetical protein
MALDIYYDENHQSVEREQLDELLENKAMFYIASFFNNSAMMWNHPHQNIKSILFKYKEKFTRTTKSNQIKYKYY